MCIHVIPSASKMLISLIIASSSLLINLYFFILPLFLIFWIFFLNIFSFCLFVFAAFHLEKKKRSYELVTYITFYQFMWLYSTSFLKSIETKYDQKIHGFSAKLTTSYKSNYWSVYLLLMSHRWLTLSHNITTYSHCSEWLLYKIPLQKTYDYIQKWHI